MVTEYKTVRDFMKLHFLLRWISDIIVLTENSIISTGNGNINEGYYLYSKITELLRVVSSSRQRRIEVEYNFNYYQD